MGEHCTVTALYSYSVKSCRGSPVTSAKVSPTGIEGDRQLMILKDAKFTNQARLPKLAAVATRRLDETTIEFDCAAKVPLVHAVTAEGVETNVNFYGNNVAVVDQGDEVADYVSGVVGVEVRVVGLKAAFRRAVPLEEFSL
ncbi:MAG: MOSC N-terminal beta barrel domain-containing protein, partial [Pseudomonadota bacterium]|nr:MOSC N-terminal beta barrel domain-containing protein [Pseudomonadota bacterium]